MRQDRLNWDVIIDRCTPDRFVDFSVGLLDAHSFRNTSMEARRLLDRYGDANKVRNVCLNIARRRHLV